MKQIEMGKKTPQKQVMSNCIPQETVIENVRLAAAYVPYQVLCALFTPVEALRSGTTFPELYSPYKGEDKKSRPCQLETMQKERI
ncbi:spore coat associated protein CotJA [Clostridium estertheticum]|uniref:spore coat associated protein CotJA n=1 Tax=Clostridium estertheticum TaxID=238834 RepID=UPI001CD14832|nr:spore coat associated protein CotJA [Clostridium estertheticum]MBZ9686718.1 spore coat associated protein CotJA [Clostridium estertheticum]